jgi:hypothetical protein
MTRPLWLSVLVSTLVDFPPESERAWEILEEYYRGRKSGKVTYDVVSW